MSKFPDIFNEALEFLGIQNFDQNDLGDNGLTNHVENG